PSGRARATASVAMTPLPPTRFSTTNCCENVSLRRAAARRPMRSILPPAANGTSTLTGLCGQVCGCARELAVRTIEARRPPTLARRTIGHGLRRISGAISALLHPQQATPFIRRDRCALAAHGVPAPRPRALQLDALRAA